MRRQLSKQTKSRSAVSDCAYVRDLPSWLRRQILLKTAFYPLQKTMMYNGRATSAKHILNRIIRFTCNYSWSGSKEKNGTYINWESAKNCASKLLLKCKCVKLLINKRLVWSGIGRKDELTSPSAYLTEDTGKYNAHFLKEWRVKGKNAFAFERTTALSSGTEWNCSTWFWFFVSR